MRIISMVKKNAKQIKDMGTSKSTIKRNLYEWKHRVSKTMVTIENKKARLDVARKHKKKKKKILGGKKMDT